MDLRRLKKYCVDIVFCIDTTGSMSPIIRSVKKYAVDFYDKVHFEMELQGKQVDLLRVKVISFRDFACDGEEALKQSDFFVLDDQKTEFEDYVNGLRASGGGDEPENALEALVEAIRSDWTFEGAKKRQIIVLFTDASSLPLLERERTAGYPADMPQNIDELNAMWMGAAPFGASSYDPEAGRLIIMAPNVEPWNQIASTFERCWFKKVEDGTGLEDVNMDDVVNLIVKSIGGSQM